MPWIAFGRRQLLQGPGLAACMSPRFDVLGCDELVLHRRGEVADFYVLSPCVWKEPGVYHMLVRAVNRAARAEEKVARIYHAAGTDALSFRLDYLPCIAPGSDDDDHDGCEDPTVAAQHGKYYVYYSGWNQSKLRGHLMFATGYDMRTLHKQGRVFGGSERFQNAKEATIVQTQDGTWRLFFEYAEDDKSKIGVASARSLDGPWEFGAPPFSARAPSWDSWHLSTGPVSMADPSHPIMFYNGANREAHWRIGWAEFDAGLTAVTDRCTKPLLMPPTERELPEDTDIAFAASAVIEQGLVGLYYTVADRLMMRALVSF